MEKLESKRLKVLESVYNEKLKQLFKVIAEVEKFKNECNPVANNKLPASLVQNLPTKQLSSPVDQVNQVQNLEIVPKILKLTINTATSNHENVPNPQVPKIISIDSQTNTPITLKSQNLRPNSLAILKRITRNCEITVGLELCKFRKWEEYLKYIGNVIEESVIVEVNHVFKGEASFWYHHDQQDLLSWEQLIKRWAKDSSITFSISIMSPNSQ